MDFSATKRPIKFNYAKLRGKTIEMGKIDRDVAAAAGLNPSTYSAKLNGKSMFTNNEIYDICVFLGIDLADVHEYFFVEEFIKNKPL